MAELLTDASKGSLGQSNPGSYIDFVTKNHIKSTTEAIERYSDALHIHRLALAAELGITLDDLHDRKFYREESVA